MGLQVLAPRAIRRIEKALNPPGRSWYCPHRVLSGMPSRIAHLGVASSFIPVVAHRRPSRVTIARAVSNGGYAYFFTVADPSREDGHRHGWMDLKLWREHVQWPWGDLPVSVQYDCEFKMGMPAWWQRKGVWGWDDDPVHWTSCRELFSGVSS